MVPADATLAPTLTGLGERPRVVLDRLAEYGFRAVQLSASQPGLRPPELDRSGRRDLAGRLRRLALAAAGLDLWIPRAQLLDPARVDRAVGTMLDAVGLAADLGRCPLSLILLEASDEPTFEAIIETVIDRALRLGVALADHGVPPVSRADIGVGVDPAAWLSHGRDPAAAIADHAQRLVVVRLCDLTADGQRTAPGAHEDGRLNLPSYRVAISSGGYRNHVVVDTRGWTEPWESLARAARAWADAEVNPGQSPIFGRGSPRLPG